MFCTLARAIADVQQCFVCVFVPAVALRLEACIFVVALMDHVHYHRSFNSSAGNRSMRQAKARLQAAGASLMQTGLSRYMREYDRRQAAAV